jgi:hypothetical protein
MDGQRLKDIMGQLQELSYNGLLRSVHGQSLKHQDVDLYLLPRMVATYPDKMDVEVSHKLLLQSFLRHFQYYFGLMLHDDYYLD